MTSIDRVGGVTPTTAVSAVTSDSGFAARGAMASVGERVLAWTAANFGTGDGPAAAWSARTGVDGGGFAPNHAELSRGGDVYELRALTAEIAAEHGATPAQEGALGRAVEDFARAVALRFNALAGGAAETMVGDAAAAIDAATAGDGPGGIDGVTQRIENAARAVETLNH